MLAALWRGGLAVLTAQAWGRSAWVGHMAVDVWGWLDFWNMAQRGLVPYVDITKEYPVGAGLFYWALAPLLDLSDPRQVLAVHGLVLAAFEVVNAGLLYALLLEVAPRRAFPLAAAYVFAPTAMALGALRFEPVVLTFVLLGEWARRKGSPSWAALWWSLGAVLKWFPALFVAGLAARAVLRERRWRTAIAASAVLLVVLVAANLPFVLAGLARRGTADAWLHTYRFHAERHLYLDTVLGVVQAFAGPLSFERMAAWWSAAAALATLRLARRLDAPRLGIAGIVAAFALNRVHSPQFHLWFLPFVLLVVAELPWAQARRVFAWWAASDLLNVAVYPVLFTPAVAEVDAQPPGFWTALMGAAILARAAALVGLAVDAARYPPVATGSAGSELHSLQEPA